MSESIGHLDLDKEKEEILTYLKKWFPNQEFEARSILEKESKWKQRDLEDQIKEEKFKAKKMATTTVPAKAGSKKVSAQKVIALLKQGYSRYKSGNKEGIGSIQEHYNLTLKQTKELFKDSRLAGKRASRRVGEPVEVVDEMTAEASADPWGGDPWAKSEAEVEDSSGSIPDRGEIGESKNDDIFA